MNKKIFYICDICGLAHSDEEAAIKCEESHSEVISVQSFYDSGSTQPTVIKAVLSDGSEVNFISEKLIKFE